MDTDKLVYWLTGASSGIGESLFKELDASGGRVILSARNRSKLEQLLKHSKHPQQHRILEMDLADANSLSDKAAEAEGFFGHIDVMVHNAGVSQRSLVVETGSDVDRQIMEVNFFGPVILTKHLLPGMLARGQGNFVVISSLVGKIGTPLRSGYAASKHALHGFFESLRAEVTDAGINILIVCPGFIRTNISVNALSAGGQVHNQMDNAQAAGMDPGICARKIIRAFNKGKSEVFVGGKEVWGVYLFRFFPNLFRRLIRKARVT